MSKLLDVLAECCREIKQKSMKKKLIFEVEEGITNTCKICPFGVLRQDKGYYCRDTTKGLNCNNYDLSTLKFIGEEDYDNEH